MDSTTFSSLGLEDPIVRAVEAEGYTTPTPIQAKAIPPVLEGRDLIGCAQTGTGKTAAFALPILDQLRRRPRAKPGRAPRVLVIAPTRELAMQIGESFEVYGKNAPQRVAVIVGGVGQGRQTDVLSRGVDVLVACPGRLLDLLGQRLVSLADVEVLVLDEADRMLDMGFLPDVRRIVASVPTKRQTLLFSATMPEPIRELARTMLSSPAEVAVARISEPAETVEQAVYFVEKNDKRRLLVHVLDTERIERAIVFSRTKHGANRIAEHLEKDGVPAAAIHGNKSQNARERALAGFKEGRIRVLVATDIAARGIDIDGLEHVINYDLPNIPETYVHRIGRTGRAGAEGSAFSFCEQEERPFLVDIERLLGRSLPVVSDHPYPSPLGVPPPTDLTKRGGGSPVQAHRGGGGGGRTHDRSRPHVDRRGAPGGEARGHGGHRDSQRQPQRDGGFSAPRDAQRGPQRDGGFAAPRDPQRGPQRDGGFSAPRDAQRAPQRDGGFAAPRDPQRAAPREGALSVGGDGERRRRPGRRMAGPSSR